MAPQLLSLKDYVSVSRLQHDPRMCNHGYVDLGREV